jgi:hypothetical protein
VIVICVGEFLSCNMIYLVYFRWAVSSIGTRLPDGKWSLGTPAFTAAVYTDILRYAEVVGVTSFFVRCFIINILLLYSETN